MTSPWLEGSFASFIRLLKFLLGGHSDSTWWTHKRRSYVHLHRQWLDRIYVCVYPPTYILSVCLSIYLYTYRCTEVPVYLPTHPPVCLSVYLSIKQFVMSYLISSQLILSYPISVCLSIYLHLSNIIISYLFQSYPVYNQYRHTHTCIHAAERYWGCIQHVGTEVQDTDCEPIWANGACRSLPRNALSRDLFPVSRCQSLRWKGLMCVRNW